MKKIVLLSTAFMFSFAVLAQPKAEDVAKFNEETHDFGKIKAGTPVTYSFEIKNISDKPLVVENATASCGCTVPEKPVEPIMPGSTSLLKVQYNAAAAAPFIKDVYVTFAGIAQPKNLKITGEVLSAEAYDEWVKEKEKDKQKDKASKTKEKPNN